MLRPSFDRNGVKIYQGDVREVLPKLPANSVHCVVTSPPYWGLRDYGTAEWEGGDADCKHAGPPRCSDKSTLHGFTSQNVKLRTSSSSPPKGTCTKCGAVRVDSQLGLEPTPQEFLKNMVAVFREVRRVLRDDGTLWLNMGDCYATGAGMVGERPGGGPQGDNWKGPTTQPNRMKIPGLKPKDLVGMPWRLALALQEDGWWLRSDIVWNKVNAMPESVTDRPSKSHEYIFLLTKSARYYYDHIAIRVPLAPASLVRISQPGFEQQTGGFKDYAHHGRPDRSSRKAVANLRKSMRRSDMQGYGLTRGTGNPSVTHPAGANKRSVWTVNPDPFEEAHFATFPQELITPCILAGTSERGCCAVCGAPYLRVVEKVPSTMNIQIRDARNGTLAKKSGLGVNRATDEELENYGDEELGSVETIGWEPGCKHEPGLIRRCVVMDPFLGSGTTALVAKLNHCEAVGVELNPEYVEMASRRLAQDVLLFG